METIEQGASISKSESDPATDGGSTVATNLLIGQAEQYLSEMESGDLKRSLCEIQDLLVRNKTLIEQMEDMTEGSNDREIAERRALYTMELRSNMIELTRLTAEVRILPDEVSTALRGIC